MSCLSAEFEAAIARGGVETSLLRERREPQARVAERRWDERRVRLDGGDEPAILVLRVSAPPGSPVDGDFAGWTVPRIEPASS